MEIKKYLEKFVVNKYIGNVSGKECHYLKATYRFKNNRFYASYYIVNFTDNDFMKEWGKKEDVLEFVDKFQLKFIADDFFASEGDSRFNFYFIIIVPDASSILNFSSFIENEFRYARKIVLPESRVASFFDKDFIMVRQDENNSSEGMNQYETLIDLSKVSVELSRYAENAVAQNLIIQLSRMKKKKAVKMPALAKHLSTLETISSLPVKRDKIRKTKLLNNCDSIFAIETIKISNYRNFKQTYNIPFGRVNLLCGDNGAGKTSILEAIELGMTGSIRKSINKSWKNADIQIVCRNKTGRITLKSQESYSQLSNKWYGIESSNKEDLNLFFNKYNYFDTGWASLFAIEGKEEINIKQLQMFLGTDSIENSYKELKQICGEIIQLNEENKQNYEKNWELKYMELLGMPSVKARRYKQIQNDTQKLKSDCMEKLDYLENKLQIITYTEILNNHLRKIEKIFKFLISSNEYEKLRIINDEIVAIKSCKKEKISMSKMSTGHKVCLALAVMFSLFLSNDKCPNIVLLDEPVANLDDLHMLNLFDLLRRMVIGNTQIFFTTANPDVAKLFRRKFSFMENDFRYFNISESDKEINIDYEIYDLENEKPVSKQFIRPDAN